MLLTLVEMTNQSRHQQKTLTQLMSNGQADSIMLKTLSVVATVCLPASLVAVSSSPKLPTTILLSFLFLNAHDN